MYIFYIEDAGSTAGVAGVVEAQTGQIQKDKPSEVMASAPDMLQHLVTEAVKKVLADQEVTDTEKVSQNIVSQVVEGLKPTLSSGSTGAVRNVTSSIGKHVAIPTSITKPVTCVYNPTPIAELKKRHIPVVSYMPTRESRVAVKRKFSPERAKPWSIVQETSNSQVTSEIMYKPTAIVNTIIQDEQSYVPTVKLDTFSSNSYDDSNSNDYQPKFKEGYYPKSKKRREEYVPKKIKASLKTVQQLNDATLNQYESEFDMIDEIITSNHPTSIGQGKASTSEDSQDYSLDFEPKFSDDESMENISTDEHNVSIKKSEQTENVNEKEKENLQHVGTDTTDKQMSNKDNKIHSNHYDAKTGDIKSSDRSKQHKANDSKKLSERREDIAKLDTDKEKEKHRDHNKSKERDRKDRHSSEKRDKERSKHKSDSRDRHRSSSSRDKDKRRSSRDDKDSSHRSKEHSDSRRHRHTSPKKDRNDHHKSNQRDKRKSSSSSSNSKSRSTSRNDRKRRSESNRRSSDSSKKLSKQKESSSEKNSSDRSDSSVDSIHSFIDNEILELSDSDHDVQEECLRIFQVNNLYISNVM